MGLETYHKKRDFRQTPEPKGKVSKVNRHRFVVQEHHASKLHFDFRLEMGGVLKSWSIPKGPSLDPADKRFAVPTEDHPVEYLKFQGQIPEGNYGAGRHMIWDAGRYELTAGQEALAQLEKGRLNFRLHGDKLQGEFNLIRMGQRDDQWLLIKSRDEYAEPGWKLKLLLDEGGGGDGRSKAGAKRSERRVKRAVKKIGAKATDESRAIAATRFFKAKELSGDAFIKTGREVIALTHLDKVYWPEDGYTKGDLIKYYYEASKYILPYLKDRPLIMKRYPNGIEGPSFHQHDVNEVPEFVTTARLSVEEGHEVDYILGDNAATLIYMANLGAIERHPWHSRLKNLDHPDWLVFDLDPGEGIAFSTICELALGVKDVLARLGLDCYAKTSGSRGLHVYVPVRPRYSYAQVADFAERVARLAAAEHARIATVERSLKNRKRGQIYLDHMQNARGKSVVAPYSVRPKRGATVSAPLDWSEVEGRKITIQDFHIRNMVQRVARKGDLFKPVLGGKQGLDEAIEKARELSGK
ncbi:MAG TPA: non-homologous end-joining DNA ligase [Pyrinomonadaceae bacterium]|nr:non-homologous end-joining DNA ligase [Pyrinomonadaceae bacterium]